MIWSLVRKPGAFARYRHRESMFPMPVFRRAYDALSEALPERQAELDYLRILHLAASTMQCEVEAALELVLGEGQYPWRRCRGSAALAQAPELRTCLGRGGRASRARGLGI